MADVEIILLLSQTLYFLLSLRKKYLPYLFLSPNSYVSITASGFEGWWCNYSHMGLTNFMSEDDGRCTSAPRYLRF